MSHDGLFGLNASGVDSSARSVTGKEQFRAQVCDRPGKPPPEPRRVLATRLLVALLVAMLLGAAPAQPRRAHPTSDEVRFSAGTSSIGIPISLANNHVAMRGRLQRSDSIWVVLDTGAGGSVMEVDLARRMGIELEGQHQAHGAGGSVPQSNASNLTLELPGFELTHERVGAIELSPLSAQGGRSLDFILGHPLFQQCVVEVDYPGRVLNLYDADTYVYRGNGVSVPLRFVHNLPYVEATLELAGRKPIKGRFVIDSGSSFALILTAEFIEKERALETVSRTIQALGRGVGGASQNPVGRVEGLTLGGFEMKEPLTLFRGAGPGRISEPGSIGNIGGQVLRRFKVIFDYPRKRMILEPNLVALAEPFEADMSGLNLVSEAPDFRVVRVSRVLEDSPAAVLGLQVGDEIEQVDERPAGEIGVSTIREWFRHDGREFKLAVKRGEERLEMRLRTRRMI